MARDVKAIKELLRTIESLASDAKILAVGGTSLSERIQWESSMMYFGHLICAMEWVVKNTESAIASEAAEKKRIEEVEEFWRQSDAKLRAKRAAV